MTEENLTDINKLEGQYGELLKAKIDKMKIEAENEQKRADTEKKEKEETKLRDTIREEILTELSDKSTIQTTTEKPSPAVTGVVKSATLNLEGGQKTDLVLLKKSIDDRRASTLGDEGGALPLDLSKAEAYRAPEDNLDYYSKVRWLKSGGKKAQLREMRKANKVIGVIGK